jgi:hypothetical protein
VIRSERRSDGEVEAIADIVVGVEARRVRVPLGRFPDAIDPGGLRGTPVVVVTDAELEPMIRRGAACAGRASVGVARDVHDPLGAVLLSGSSLAEVLVVHASPPMAGDAMVTARALGGRPLPVVPLEREADAAAMLEPCWVDLDIAVPALDEPRRAAARRAVRSLGLVERHHIVEVDPRPGLEGESPADATLQRLTAAATGVLAGRIAAANRRWR